jgi:MFS transporter, DHA2 family, methylenomycin A resistance protein
MDGGMTELASSGDSASGISLTSPVDSHPERARQLKRKYLIAVIATSAAFFMIILDTSIVNLALPRIGSEFAANRSTLQWLVDGYAVVFASLLLSAGALGDRYGARRIFRAGLVVFTLASALCGMAPSATVLEVARVMQGVGAALLLPNSLATLSNAFEDPTLRKKAIASWSAAGAFGIALGPVLGGVLVHELGWRSVFDANIPVGLLALWLAGRLADPPRSQTRSIDIPGQMLAISALATLAYTLIQANLVEASTLAWLSALFVILGSAFIATEYFRSEPMLPLHLISRSMVGRTALIGMFHNVSIYGLIFVLGLAFQQLHGMDPIEAGLRFLPLTLGLAVGTRIGGRLLLKFGPLPSLIWGHLAACSGAALLGVLGAGVGQPVSLCIIGLGAGITTPAMNLAVLDAAAPTQAGLASGILNAARQTGGVIGVALLGTLVGEPISTSGLKLAAFVASGAFASAGCLALAAATRWKAA